MSLLTDISFLNICMALVTVGVVERLMAYLPATMVGPEGWLLQTKQQ